ncbi:MAG TPA: TRAM domain-containing protein, partial [Actinomycetota bacterium]|nr:TRAM domain-containing protein [Actinomycetota bacterium]
GRTFEVLVEGPSKKDPTRLTGRTRSNKVVHFPGDVDGSMFRDVLINSAAPHFLEGEALVS